MKKISTICIIGTLLIAGLSITVSSKDLKLDSKTSDVGYIEGLIRNEINEPMENANINCESLLSYLTNGKRGIVDSIRTDSTGHFQIELPAKKYYYVSATHQSAFIGGMSLTYVLPDETSWVEMTMYTEITEEDLGTIEGYVKNTRGKAIEDAQVQALTLSPPIGAVNVTNDQGYYSMIMLGGRQYQIMATAPSFKLQGEEQYMSMANMVYLYRGETARADLYIPQLFINTQQVDSTDTDSEKTKVFNIRYESQYADKTLSYFIDFEGDGIFDYELLDTMDKEISIEPIYDEYGDKTAIIMIIEGELEFQDCDGCNMVVSLKDVEIKKDKTLEKSPLSQILMRFLERKFDIFSFLKSFIN